MPVLITSRHKHRLSYPALPPASVWSVSPRPLHSALCLDSTLVRLAILWPTPRKHLYLYECTRHPTNHGTGTYRALQSLEHYDISTTLLRYAPCLPTYRTTVRTYRYGHTYRYQRTGVQFGTNVPMLCVCRTGAVPGLPLYAITVPTLPCKIRANYVPRYRFGYRAGTNRRGVPPCGQVGVPWSGSRTCTE